MNAARLRELLLVAALNVAALGASLTALRDPREGAVAVVAAPSPTPAPTPTVALLHVYVSGAVASPDVVALAPGARAADAVAAAGGFAEDADRAGLNLAAPLGDGQQLHVPAEGEIGGGPAGIAAHGAASAAGGQATVGGAASGPAGAASGSLVDVNRATAAELEALPGVGPALAARIVAYRDANGPYASPDDLERVSGIGARTLERMRPFLVVR